MTTRAPGSRLAVRLLSLLSLGAGSCLADPDLPPPPPPPAEALPAVELTFQGEPADGLNDASASATVVATTREGQVDPKWTGPVTLTLLRNGIEVPIGGTTTVPAEAGVAAFANLKIFIPGTDYQLRAVASGLKSGTSRLFTITDACAPPRSCGGWSGTIVLSTCHEWVPDPQFGEACGSGGFSLLNPDGSERLLTNSSRADEDPAWSPDGRWIALTGYRHCAAGSATPCEPALYFLSAAGDRIERLSPPGLITYSPAWSPDGTRIAFSATTNRNAPWRLMVMNDNGSNLHPLGTLMGFAPVWSPSGARIAYGAQDASGHWSIFTANADGSTPFQLTTPAMHGPETANDWTPVWSPDGHRIAFTRTLLYADGHSSCQVFVMEADGSDERVVTQDGFCARKPVWSPDGAWIAYGGMEPGTTRFGLMLIRPDGTHPFMVRAVGSDFSRVAWKAGPGSE